MVPKEITRRILVAAASKHGSTTGIAERIGGLIQQAGFDVDVNSINDDPDVAAYDAAVVGGGVYCGSWLKDGRRFIDSNASKLGEIPVWLFSSGLLGDPPDQKGDVAVKSDALVAATQAEDHVILFGSLSRADLGFGEMAIMKRVGAPEGDFRDWDQIDAWVDKIAEHLSA